MRTPIGLFLCLSVACVSGGGLPPAAIEHNSAGAELFAEGALDDAEARFRIALEYHPGFAEPHANLGLVMLRRGRLPEAEDHLRAAIRLDEDFDEAWSNLGVVLLARDRPVEAARAFEEALRIDPGRSEARRNLADLWMASGEFTEARAQLMRLVQLVPPMSEDGARANAMLAYAELRLGRRDAARERADVVLGQKPDEPHGRLVRGILRSESGQFEAAIEDLQAAMEAPSLREAAELRLAAVFVASGDQRADRLVADLLRDRVDEPAVQILAGHLALAEGDRAAARGHAERALQMVPELEPARTLLENVAELDPESL